MWRCVSGMTRYRQLDHTWSRVDHISARKCLAHNQSNPGTVWGKVGAGNEEDDHRVCTTHTNIIG